MNAKPSSPAAPVIITIDGPAGTGKSTVAHRLARRLGLEFLDTGAMYRAAALLSIEQGIDPTQGEALAQLLSTSDLHFDWKADPPRVMLGQRDVSRRIRDQDVAAVVSIVAAQPAIRAVLVEQQRIVAQMHARLVTEGRDQGSVVFPDAPVRFYLDASPEIRAARRAGQLVKAGKQVDRSKVLTDIQERDHLDATRPEGPLIRPQGAIEIDSTHDSVEQVVSRMEAIVRERLGSLLPPPVMTAKRT